LRVFEDVQEVDLKSDLMLLETGCTNQ